MRRGLPIALVIVLVAAGCVSDPDTPVDAADSAPTNTSVQVGERPEPTFSELNNSQVGEVAAPDANATLAAPPKLTVGEWWRIEMESPLDGRKAEYVRVLAAIDGDTYVFGMPHEGWYKEAVVYHVPFFGDVNLDLSGHAHDVHFLPLKFPLEDGATWTTEFEGPPTLTATVDADEEAKTAKVTFRSPPTETNPEGNVALELTYDAKVHEIVEFKQATIHYRVVEHGYDFEGWVTVPRGEDLVFFHGRIAQAIGVSTENPAIGPTPSPVETVTIDGGFNRMSFILIAGDMIGAGGACVCRETATAPDGTVYQLESIGEPGDMKIEFFEATNPDGDWNLEHIAAGAGGAFIEGIAYHQYDIHVPSGLRRSDHSHPVVR